MPCQYINAAWTTGSGDPADVINPWDGSVVRTVDQAGPVRELEAGRRLEQVLLKAA